MMTLITGLLVLRPSISSLLQSATSVITKCDRYYKVRRLLQSATVQRQVKQSVFSKETQPDMGHDELEVKDI